MYQVYDIGIIARRDGETFYVSIYADTMDGVYLYITPITGMSEENTDRTDEKLTPKTAYNLTENQGMTQSEVGEMFGVSQPRVSTLKNQYLDAREEGKSEVTPDDFEAQDLASALEDKPPEENPYASAADCPACGEDILQSEKPDSPGEHDCPHCSQTIVWSEDEI